MNKYNLQCGEIYSGQMQFSMLATWKFDGRGSEEALSPSLVWKIICAIWTNNICKVDKYNLQFGQIHFGQMPFLMQAIWKFDDRGSEEAILFPSVDE